MVIQRGDVLRVNLASGESTTMFTGKLPPESLCEAARAGEELLFVCSKDRRNAASFVVSLSGDGKGPEVEQTFQAQGTFFASDDGGLAFGGPCKRPVGSSSVVCVRNGSGGWQEYDLDPLAVKFGGTIDVARWVPTVDGTAIGVLRAPSLGLVDARSQEVHTFTPDALASQGNVLQMLVYTSGQRTTETGHVIDRGWSPVLRAGCGPGMPEASPSSRSTGWSRPLPSPSRTSSLPVAMRSAPPTTGASIRPAIADRPGPRSRRQSTPAARCRARRAASQGAMLVTWYRPGWRDTPPTAKPVFTVAAAPSQLPAVPLPELACKPTTETKRMVLAHTDQSPEDYSLGAARVATDPKGEATFARLGFLRVLGSALRNEPSFNDGASGALRAFTHGYAVEAGDRATVDGPNKDILALRRTLAFVPAFDPQGAVRRVSLAVSDVVVAARAAGVATSDLLSGDPTGVAAAVPLLPQDPAQPSDLFFSGDLVSGTVKGSSGHVKFVFPPKGNGPISAVALDGDAFAVLEADATGREVVRRSTGASMVAAFELPPLPPSQLMNPSNLDALAVNAKGELGVIRMLAGPQPPSELDPAVLLRPGAPPLALAPWSSLTLADDPACKADGAGFRAMVQLQSPWFRLTGPDLAVGDAASASVVRVKWSPSRVCLEGVENRAGRRAHLLGPSRRAPSAAGHRGVGQPDRRHRRRELAGRALFRGNGRRPRGRHPRRRGPCGLRLLRRPTVIRSAQADEDLPELLRALSRRRRLLPDRRRGAAAKRRPLSRAHARGAIPAGAAARRRAAWPSSISRAT